MSNPKDYTVSWICTIVMEYIATQVFLNENHKRLKFVSLNNNNDYTLGRVRKYNVIVTVLLYREYGILSTIGIIKDILHSFSNIRIGLMVSISSGTPSPNHDICLNNIVVSSTSNGKGGVFQYDFGKTIQGQKFQETRFLNQLLTILQAV